MLGNSLEKKKGAPEIETEVLGVEGEGEGSAGRTHRIFKTVKTLCTTL